jgi:hypothetical protein
LRVNKALTTNNMKEKLTRPYRNVVDLTFNHPSLRVLCWTIKVSHLAGSGSETSNTVSAMAYPKAGKVSHLVTHWSRGDLRRAYPNNRSTGDNKPHILIS